MPEQITPFTERFDPADRRIFAAVQNNVAMLATMYGALSEIAKAGSSISMRSIAVDALITVNEIAQVGTDGGSGILIEMEESHVF